MGANLFTGKCGFLFSDKIPYMDLFIILIVNMLAGYLFGYLYTYCDSDVVLAATNKVASWNLEFPFFVKSILCGCIMYIAVYMYKKGTSLGIIYGIPLFIFCGFQHCVANVITLGVARTFHWSLLLAILGNFVGSLFVWYLFSEDNKKQKKKR